MTAYIAYLIKFLFRIKWWLILCPSAVALLMFFYIGRLPRTYKSLTTVYTGIVSGYGHESGGDSRQDWNVINNAMDNLINIIQSQSTLHNVSMRLYALNMSKGNPELNPDNKYLTPGHYREEVKRTPDTVLKMIVPNNVDSTLKNLYAFENADRDNHVYGLFRWTHQYYSYLALSNIHVKRIANSDMLEISYENNDPYVVYNTLDILNDEFVKQYKDLRFGETNNVIAFFEGELNRVGMELQGQEDSLRDYNIENQIINYDEQTKHITTLSRDFELQYEAIRQSLNSANQLRTTIEGQLEGLKTFRSNSEFVKKLHTIGALQSRITTAEAFAANDMQESTNASAKKPIDVSKLRNQLTHETDSLRNLTSEIANQRFTKEGIASDALVEQWLDAVLLAAKSEAELNVLAEWKESLDTRYERYAPVGSTLKRKNRLISFTEKSYLAMLDALNTARLRQKNLQMSSATLKIINPPVLPIVAESTKRRTIVPLAFFCTLVFVLGFFILLELLDRTLRDKMRAERITGGKVVGAFPGRGRFGERRYTQQYRQIAIRHIGNAALNYFEPGHRPNILNILSTEGGDGKTTIMEQLAVHFRETGMKVRTLSWNKDFNAEQHNYLLAKQLSDFAHDMEGEVSLANADLILVEYPPMDEHPTPKDLLRSASLNIVVIPANRTWKETDQLLYQKCETLSDQVPTVICLNCASRDVVQTFTGLLPPYSRLRKIGYQLSQFGFTAVK